MPWYAVDAIDDALDATRGFLFPFSLGRWARLMLITFFVGGGGGGLGQLSNLPNAGGVPTGPGGPAVPTDPAPTVPDVSWGIVLAIAAVVLLVVLVLGFIGATFEFVFVDVIAEDRVRILDPFGRHAGNGLRLLVFNLVVGIVTVAPLALIGYLAYVAGGPPGFNGIGALGTAGTVAFVAGAVVWLFLSGLVTGLTRTLVVPVMVATGTGIVGGWRRLWPRLRTEWKQTLVYLLLHFFVGIGVGLVGAVLLLFGLLLVGIVAAVVGLAAAAVTHGGDPTLGVGVGLLAAAVVGVPLYFLLVALPVGVLTTTYVRTYELASLAGFDPAFDLLGPYRPGSDDGPGGGHVADTPPDGGAGGATTDDLAGERRGRDDRRGGDDGRRSTAPGVDPTAR